MGERSSSTHLRAIGKREQVSLEMLSLFSRPAMRPNPHSWLRVFTFSGYSTPDRVVRKRHPAGGWQLHAQHRAQYYVRTVGITPAWLNA